MNALREKLRVMQNLGWLDRVLRELAGAVMLGYPVFLIMTNDEVQSPWVWYSMLLSIYPWLTGILGFDPIYAQFAVRSCDTSGTNPCGTFPYEVDAALGRKPIPNSNIEHSLEDARH